MPFIDLQRAASLKVIVWSRRKTLHSTRVSRCGEDARATPGDANSGSKTGSQRAFDRLAQKPLHSLTPIIKASGRVRLMDEYETTVAKTGSLQTRRLFQPERYHHILPPVVANEHSLVAGSAANPHVKMGLLAHHGTHGRSEK